MEEVQSPSFTFFESLETITAQKQQQAKLRAENKKLRQEVKALKGQVGELEAEVKARKRKRPDAENEYSAKVAKEKDKQAASEVARLFSKSLKDKDIKKKTEVSADRDGPAFSR